MEKEVSSDVNDIGPLIQTIRGQKVILDADLARIFGVPTFRFNEAIKRNRKRFPGDFMFQLTAGEAKSLRSQFAILRKAAASIGNFCRTLSLRMAPSWPRMF